MGALSQVGLRRLRDIGLIDLWRHQHPQSREFSFYSSAHKTYARLDYFLGSTTLQDLTLSTDILTAALSDHAPVEVTLNFPQTQRPTKHWRLRDTLLHRSDVVAQIQGALDNYLLHNDNPDTNLSTRWEALKAVTRQEFIAIFSTDNADRQKKRTNLTQKVREL